MRTLFKITIVLLAATILVGCIGSNQDNNLIKDSSQIGQNPYLEKYAGGYTIEVKGYPGKSDAELYVLHQNGKAKWMFIEIDSKGQTNIMSEKLGNWTTSENKITITIKGNTGDLVEEYNLINGIFVYGDRSLKKTN